jgi:cytochrome c oxidase subunit III
MSELAEAGPAVAAAERTTRSWPVGMWGMALLLATESAFFGLLIASYFYLRFDTVPWPPSGVSEPALALPLFMLGVLVATSVPMWLASSAAQAGRRGVTISALAVALLMQAAYLATEVLLFRSDLQEMSPRDSAYGSAYFTLLAAHHAHVAVGLLLTLFVLARVARGMTPYRVTGVRVVALYWYVVNALAVVVTLTVLSPSL